MRDIGENFFSCSLLLSFSQHINTILFLFFYKVFYWRKNREIQHKEAIIRLVERITDLIYDSGYAGIAEPHVRDMLMPPTKFEFFSKFLKLKNILKTNK